MLSHGLRQLFDAKLVASCQQTCCKLIVQTRSQQACCKLFQQVITSLQTTKVATSPILTGLLQLVDKQKDCSVFGCVYISETGRNLSLRLKEHKTNCELIAKLVKKLG